MLVVGLISAILQQMLLWTHWSCRCPGCWTILVAVWITAVLGQMDVDPEIGETVMFWYIVC